MRAPREGIMFMWAEEWRSRSGARFGGERQEVAGGVARAVEGERIVDAVQDLAPRNPHYRLHSLAERLDAELFGLQGAEQPEPFKSLRAQLLFAAR